MIRYFQTLIVLIVGISSFGCSSTKKPVQASLTSETVAIIPKPQVLVRHNGVYQIPKQNTISFSGSAEIAGQWLSKLLQDASLQSTIQAKSKRANFKLVQDPALSGQLGEEGYSLDIDKHGVTIKAAEEVGLFYAIQSLTQLLPANLKSTTIDSKPLVLPQLHVEDFPKYSWRGNMIDLARSFFGMEYLKRHIDRMALYKLNRLHLHLTDDQGWRIELKSKPLLTEIAGKSAVKDGKSGFLSIEDYKELQDYAAERHVVIIPEIDLPGHIYAALVAYPELNCEDLSNLNPKMATPPELFDGYKVGWSKLCLKDPETYSFVAEVLREVSEMTVGPWVHIGGDEINDDLYEDFVVKADSMVRSYGKIPIGWEEVSKADVSQELIVQRWNGKTTPLKRSKVIESICTSFYFDHANVAGQEKTNNWCQKSGVSLEDVYNFNDKADQIIGVEAPVWTELVISDAMLDNRLWPRLMAVAEIGWSESHDDFKEFSKRLSLHKSRLEALKINFYPAPELNP
ncbi:beta-N-acetylhexosaminidase [Gelidibacter maritimus]|uniref:beta-N-acetylhexosaminidase n=1 Tax=Gelidibacter maritimus TaxID=2761487 RepID=A0A7W2M432_9FLAO|nr:family 20 glycosylhydrolase [Gelidibacter maritimus]MBA6152360.1 beta-N-acetylhexosaminidase [Gelidibacter maritimus]